MGAAIVIAFQLCLTHWFYLYIPWFFPMLSVALIGSFPSDVGYALRVSEDEAASRPQYATAA